MEISRLARKSSLLYLSLFATTCIANVQIEPNVGAQYVHQQLKTAEQDKETGNAYIIKPSLRLSIDSEVAEGFWYVESSQLESNTNSEDNSQNFTEFRYNFSKGFQQNRLQLGFGGNQSYRTVRTSDNLSDDIILNSENLTQTRQNTAFGSYQMDESGFASGLIDTSYSIFETNQSVESLDSSTNQTFNIVSNLQQGSEQSRFRWRLNSNYENSNRASDEDVILRDVRGNLDLEFINRFAIRVNARNDVTNIDSADTGTTNTKFESYGSGLVYLNNQNRVAVTYNVGETNDEGSEAFWALEFNYNFNNRTSITGSFDRRFYGDASDFNFQYQHKQTRASIRYSETVNTSFSSPDVLNGQSSFVCPIGSEDILSCFQPSEPNYELAANEEFVDFFTTTDDLTDQTRVSKSWNSTIGYESRYFRVSLQFNDTENDFLEENRLDQSRGGTFSTAYRFSAYTQLNYSMSYQLTHQDVADAAIPRQRDEVITSAMTIQKHIGRRLQVDLTYRYLNRSSNILSRDLRENRIQINLLYRFASQYSNRS